MDFNLSLTSSIFCKGLSSLRISKPPHNSKSISSGLKYSWIFFKPSKRIFTKSNVFSHPIFSPSAMISVKLPKQAKPAFRVEAPIGTELLSTTKTDFSGNFSLMEIALHNPVKPAPIMMTSRFL